jgi:glycosyltransferase involved in cell wall biosynthesis
LPVITTRNGGQASYMKNGEDGYFLDCGDVSGLIQKIGKLLGSFAKAKEMGEQGRKSYRDLFLAKRTAEEFLKIYKHYVS